MNKTHQENQSFISFLQQRDPLLANVVEQQIKCSGKWSLVFFMNQFLSAFYERAFNFTSLREIQMVMERSSLEIHSPIEIAHFLTSLFQVDTFINRDDMMIDRSWFLWEFGAAFNSLSFIRALYKVFIENGENKVKSSIATNYGDLILDHYIPLLGHTSIDPTSDVFNVRIELAEFLSYLIIYHSAEIPRVEQFRDSLTDQLIDIMYASSSNEQIIMFRIIIDFYMKTKKGMKEKEQKSFMYFLLRHAPRYSPVHFPAVRFIINNAPIGFDWSIVSNILISQGIVDQMDIEALSQIMNHRDNKDPVEAITELFKIAVSDSILARTAIYFSLNSLRKLSAIDELKQSLQTFITNQFAFVFFTQGINQLSERRQLSLDFLSTVANLGINWITETVGNGIKTMLQMRVPSKYFSLIMLNASKIDGKVDKKIQKTYKKISSENVDSENLQLSFKSEVPLKKERRNIVSVARLGRNTDWRVRERMMLVEKMEMEKIRKTQTGHWPVIKTSSKCIISESQ